MEECVGLPALELFGLRPNIAGEFNVKDHDGIAKKNLVLEEQIIRNKSD